MKPDQWWRTSQATVNFGLILLILIINGVVVHRNTLALRATHNWVVHTHEILSQSNLIWTRLLDAESSVRGYVLSGDKDYLKGYQRALASQPEQLLALRAAVLDQPSQSEKVRRFEVSATKRISHLSQVVEAHGARGFDAARSLVSTNEGKLLMDEARESIDALNTEEQRLLKTRIEDADQKLFTILIANVIAVCLGLAISGIAWRLIGRQVARIQQAEATADIERENLLVTLNSIGDGVVVTDAAGRVQLLNPIAKQLMGHPLDVIGRRLVEVFPIVNQTTRNPVVNPVEQVLELGVIVGMHNHTLLLRPDGTEVPIEDSASPIRNKSGGLTGVILVFRDCSERWRFETELKERERRFRRMFETPLVGIATGSSDGKSLLEANDAYLDLIGCDRGALPDSSLGWGGVEAGASPLDEEAQRELKDTGVCHPFERVCTRSDGTHVPVLVSATKLLDEEDRIIVFITDLTISKRAEEALSESQARFRILSESMPQMVWTAQPNGQVDYVNQTFATYSGQSTESLLGAGWTELLEPTDRSRLVEAWKASLATGESLEVEHRLRHHDGEFRWHLTRALPMHDANHQIAQWVGTNTDIHVHKQLEALLKEEHQQKDQFLAMLAHELRNPLAPLANAVEVLVAAPQDAAQAAELLPLMQRQVQQLTRLIDDLLDVSRVSQGRMLLRRERTLVATIAHAAVEAVQPWITDRQHLLTVTLPKEELWIDADAARMAQVLTNLLQNAAKYTESGGRIALTVERAGREVLFRIQDNGPGISPSMLTRIFELFMQVEQTLDRAHGGLGIGLTLVKTLVEMHGGRVTAQSEGLGQGSQFIVRLPLIDAPILELNVTLEPPLIVAPLPSLQVLVVDDVRASAKTLAMMLHVLGQNAEATFDGPSAIDKVTAGKFAVVFLDIAMPGMDGLEVVKRLRANPDLKMLTIVALTGFGQAEDKQRSLDAGFDEHLIKPTSLDLLRGVIQRAADRMQGTFLIQESRPVTADSWVGSLPSAGRAREGGFPIAD